MHSQQSRAHHYVPEWYQRRFLLPGQCSYCYLDLHPETVIVREGKSYQTRQLYYGAPTLCFRQKDLYTLRQGGWMTDAVERRFFGEADRKGSKAVVVFGEYQGLMNVPSRDPYRNLLPYMGAQRFRTPRALDLIKNRTGRADHNVALNMMQQLFQLHTTMWSEAIWEVVRAKQSPTKFIVSDGPVTFYNRVMFKSDSVYPNDTELNEIGTRTLFPLGLDACLIITHLQLIRNPWATPTEFRRNARSFRTVLTYLGNIQFGRELEEDEVLRVNHILKQRATRYLAAAEEEWLYPERRVSTTDWTKLDDDWFLFPNLWKVPFTTGVMAGGGPSLPYAADEYGYHPGNREYNNEKFRQMEHLSCDRAQLVWAKKRIGKSVAHIEEFNHDGVHDKMMNDYLSSEGLLP
jgi:Protein of unknown function (DUF4238)